MLRKMATPPKRGVGFLCQREPLYVCVSQVLRFILRQLFNEALETELFLQHRTPVVLALLMAQVVEEQVTQFHADRCQYVECLTAGMTVNQRTAILAARKA